MNEEQAQRLRAFLADIQSACQKHGCEIQNWDEEGIALVIAGQTSAIDLKLNLYSIAADAIEAAEWIWSEEVERIAEGMPDAVRRGFAFTTDPDVRYPAGTRYKTKERRTVPYKPE